MLVLSLRAIYDQFPTNDECVAYLEELRWQGEPTCPHCGSTKHTPLINERRYHCNGCNTNYSVTAKTIFHGTHIELQKWFLTIALMMNPGKDPTVRRLASDLGVNKNTACFLAMRIRVAKVREFKFMRQLADEITRRSL